MTKTAQEIIETIKADGTDDPQSIIDVLEDGEALAALGITDEDQEAVELAHASLLPTTCDVIAVNVGNIARLASRAEKQAAGLIAEDRPTRLMDAAMVLAAGCAVIGIGVIISVMFSLDATGLW